MKPMTMKSIIMTLSALAVISNAGAQSRPMGPARVPASCHFAWYWEYSPTRLIAESAPDPSGGAHDRHAWYPAVVAAEGVYVNVPLSNVIPLSPWWVTSVGRPYYRWQTADFARPWLRAEVLVEHPGITDLPSRQNDGFELLASWLVDRNAGCHKTCRYSGTSWPKFIVNFATRFGDNGRALAVLTPSMTERFVSCSGANNGVGSQIELELTGSQFRTTVGTTLGFPPSASISVTTMPASQVSHPRNHEVAGNYAEDINKKATADRMLLLGSIQSRLRVDGSFALPPANVTVLHAAVYGSDHRSSLFWSATPSGIPVFSGLPTPVGPPLPPPGGGGGGTTPPPGGGTTPITTYPWPGPRPPFGFGRPPNLPRGQGIGGGYVLGGGGITSKPGPTHPHPLSPLMPAPEVWDPAPEQTWTPYLPR